MESCGRAPNDAPKPDSRHALVIGGGLAGLAVTVALVERGWKVTLLEARPRLGGRASSFNDPATGELIDTCQHVGMGACTNLADFCRRVGIDDHLARQAALYFQDERGRVSQLRGARLPAPLHLLPDLIRARFLTIADKLRIARGMWALLRTPADSTNGAFRDWLRRHGQTERTCTRFWGLILTSALNETLENTDFHYARQVFVEGFLWNRAASIVAIPTVPLAVLYGDKLTGWLAEHGVCLRLNTAATSLTVDGDRVVGCTLRSGETLPADAYVLAVPFHRVAGLLPDNAQSRLPMLRDLATIESSPITSVHLWYDRPVMDFPHLVTVGRTIQWLFRRPQAPRFKTAAPTASSDSVTHLASADTNNVTNGQYLQAVISASRELATAGNERTKEIVLAEVAAILPKSRSAKLLHCRVVTERQATFSVRPGIDRLRPTQRTGIDNLWLAGDYTSTGWPATMEGAVKSGYLAAEAILDAHGQPQAIVQPLLPLARLTRLFGGAALACKRVTPDTLETRVANVRFPSPKDQPSPKPD